MTQYIIYVNQQWVGDHSEEWFMERAPLAESPPRSVSRSARACRPRRNHIEPGGSGRLTEPVIVGENSICINPHSSLQMQSVEGRQVRHGQESGATVDGSIKGRESNSVKDAGHVSLVEALADGDTAQLGLEQIA